MSVAYVFVHILPDLCESQITFEKALGSTAGYLQHHVFIMALAGLVVFYGLECLASTSQRGNSEVPETLETSVGAFWIHIGAFALYNALIGYLLVHRETPGLSSLVFYFVALSLHFMVNDAGLRRHHKHRYHNTGRWILAGAVILGWAIGAVTEIQEVSVALLFSLLAGSILLNILKEEFPSEQYSRFWAFADAAALYTALLLLI